jgi:predicted enzyme related to lactoylglutathione lyase
MPERTGYAHGTPSWVDLATTDLDGAKAFYGAIFGWEAMDLPTDDQRGSYTMFTKDGKAVAGMAELLAEQAAAGVPPLWSTYIAVDDVDDVVSKATAAGASVMMPATDVMDSGRVAFIVDPTGAAVGLWQAGSHIGAGVVNEHGTFTWNELITDDTAAAATFYADVFGYRVETTDTPNGPYTMFWAEGNVEGNAAAGMLAKNENMGEFPNYWGVYFAVDDCDGCLESAKTRGGKVLMQPMDIPGVGRMAVVQDPQGATFSVMTYEQEQK